MFKKLFGKGKEVNKNIKIYAPLTGEYVKIEDIQTLSSHKNDGRRFRH